MFRDVFESRWDGLSQDKIEIKTMSGAGVQPRLIQGIRRRDG